MKFEMQLFKNQEFGEIRAVEINGEPWLVGKDVAIVLGYKNTRQAISSNVDEEDRGVHQIDTPSGVQEMTIINESGLYSLVISSKLPTAKKFKKWVTSEVLPSVRKHGAYMTPKTIDELLANPDLIIQLATQLKEERAERKRLEEENEVQRQTIADYTPKVLYYDTILQSKEALAVTQIAADYGLSAKALNKILHEEGIQHRVGNQWVLYRKYMGEGYTKSETIPISRTGGVKDSVLFTKWTQKGRILIHRLLESRGIKAVMDLEEEE